MSPYLDIEEEVIEAIRSKKPVVALESTIISHGMPWPKNVETALAVEQVIRDNGAVPATIAIIGGRLKAGLSKAEIEHLGKAGLKVAKASRRDIARIVANKTDGATTVAATMLIAKMAGIRIFATGGIGGVHRGAETSMDISADLEELARTGVAVVCAGAKSILDIPKTLEYLETKSVPVLVYKGSEFPAFYTSHSGIKAELVMNSPSEIADLLIAHWTLGFDSGAVIANPIPAEYEMPAEVISKAIEEALKEADKNGVHGKDVTPFLLAKVKDLTGGDSLEANIALVKNNASLASKVAKSLVSGRKG